MERYEASVSYLDFITSSLHHCDFPSGANGEGVAEIDEGFDEGFCDGEELGLPKDMDIGLEPSLDMQEIQYLLTDGTVESDIVPNSTFLDDFDLGVDVFDTEHSGLIDPGPLKSPLAHVPHSPYHVSPISSPVAATGDFQSVSLNAYNIGGEDMNDFSEYCDSHSCHGAQGEDLLCTVCDNFGTSISHISLRDAQTSPGSTNTLPSRHSLAGFVMDATQFINLNLTELPTLFQTTTTTCITTPVIEKPLNFIDCTTEGTLNQASGGDQHGIKSEEDRSSQGSQTAGSSPSSQDVSAVQTSPGGGAGFSLTSESSASASLPKENLISMPFYQFKKVVENSTASDRDKHEAKSVRRRGKNKVAAKHCRQRKLEIIYGLQKEVEQLKAAKVKVEVQTLTLEQEIEAMKKRCALMAKNS